jgi:hypothetical protein
MKKYTENDHRYALRKANKIRAINELGGKCKICGEKRVHMLEFHHKGKEKDKKDSISQILDSRWSLFQKEVSKCIILCSNCHAELHCDIYKTEKNRAGSHRKIMILKEIGVFKCDRCGYSGKNFASLDFHHVDRKNKKFKIAGAARVTIEEIIDETKKCRVICKNCHRDKHFNRKKFNSMMPLIKYKINHPKEKTRPLDKSMVWKMYNKDKRNQKYLTEYFGVGAGTISYILKLIRERLANGTLKENKNGFLRTV